MPISVRVMSDHSGWPLWDDEGATGPEHWPMLSDALKERLRAWHEFWSVNFSHMTGWASGSAERYAHDGEALRDAVADELGPGYVVTLQV